MTASVFVAVDTETTGFSHAKGATVTQVAAVAIDADTGQFVSQGNLRIRITDEDIRVFSKEAADVQGWTPELNAQGLPLAACVEQYRAWFAGLPEVRGYIAHSAGFDRAFMGRMGFSAPAHPWYCTKEGMKVAERLNKHPKFLDHKLKTLAAACGYIQRDAHQALDDVLACANGFNWLRSLGTPLDPMMIAAGFARL
jgi:DNA polymerase III epsilon subunit-like protein